MRRLSPVLLRHLAAGLAGLAWSCGNGTGVDGEIPDCGLKYAQVEADSTLASEYFSQQPHCEPELKAATESGRLLGLMYAPSDATLRAQFMRVYGDRGYSALETGHLIEATLVGLDMAESFALAEISSTDMNYFGRQVPVFILINRVTVGSPVIRNEFDLRSLFAHELQHVADWHDGLEVGGSKVDGRSLSEAAVRVEWLVQLMEMRADYKVLSLIFQDHVETDSMSHSHAWFSSQAPNYWKHWEAVSALAATETERALAASQKAVFAGLVPEARGDTLLLHFNLYGKKETAVFLVDVPAAPKGLGIGSEVAADFLDWRRR